MFVTAAFVLAASVAATELPPNPGETWESTVEISMTGEHSMTMPPQTQTICRPSQGFNEPPGLPTDGNCTMYDLKRTPAGMTWSIDCKTPVMKGNGEMTYQGPGAYKGQMSMTMAEGAMSMKLAGKRIGNPCDANEKMRQIRQTQHQAEVQGANAMVEVCAQSAKAGQSAAFVGANAFCKGPENKAMFCGSIETEEGFAGVSYKAGDTSRGIAEAATYCGTTVDGLRSKVCARALAAENLQFVAQQCPQQADEIAKRECAGRTYTALAGTKYAQFCGTYAQAMLAGDDAAQNEESKPAETKETTKEKGKKLIKGLFGK